MHLLSEVKALFMLHLLLGTLKVFFFFFPLAIVKLNAFSCNPTEDCLYLQSSRSKTVIKERRVAADFHVCFSLKVWVGGWPHSASFLLSDYCMFDLHHFGLEIIFLTWGGCLQGWSIEALLCSGRFSIKMWCWGNKCLWERACCCDDSIFLKQLKISRRWTVWNDQS